MTHKLSGFPEEICVFGIQSRDQSKQIEAEYAKDVEAIAHFYVLTDMGSGKVFSVPVCWEKTAEILAAYRPNSLGILGIVSWYRSKNKRPRASVEPLDYRIDVFSATDAKDDRARLHSICKIAAAEQPKMLQPYLRFVMSRT
jgi:hypothetical protein